MCLINAERSSIVCICHAQKLLLGLVVADYLAGVESAWLCTVGVLATRYEAWIGSSLYIMKLKCVEMKWYL
jgi:hypothetical protein